jgi:hypothetical protein
MTKNKSELDLLQAYLTNPGTENAKDYLVFPPKLDIAYKRIAPLLPEFVEELSKKAFNS